MTVHSQGESGLFVTSALKLLRGQSIGSLATVDAKTGHPLASLVTLATQIDASPVILISKLALHTRNLEADPRASIMLAESVGSGDPLALGRVTVMGTAEPLPDKIGMVRDRFLSRHPGASAYVDFADFAFWRLKLEQAHYIGGFGRIVTLSGADLAVQPDATLAWHDSCPGAIADANSRHAELIAQAAASPEEGWQMLACDPDGCDIVRADRHVRIAFARRLTAPHEIIDALQAFVRGDIE